jgi:hypothetical protein
MKKFLRKPALIICASVFVIASAAVSYASFKGRNATETKEAQQAITRAPLDAAPVESIEPVGNTDVQSAVKPNMHNNSYEQQGAMMNEREARHNEALQQTSTE